MQKGGIASLVIQVVGLIVNVLSLLHNRRDKDKK